MTAGERRYGDGQSHPLPIWSGILDHYGKLGLSVWSFIWLIDRVTIEKDGAGKVLGGKPVKIEDIVATMKGATYKMVRDQLDTLEREGYISRKRTPWGQIIEVRNSRKWGIWTKKVIAPTGQSVNAPTGQSVESDCPHGPLTGQVIGPTGQCNKTLQEETQQKRLEESPGEPATNQKAKRATPYPEDFAPSDVGTEVWAQEQGVDPDIEIEKFRDYHTAKGTTFKDWNAAWRNWIRKAVEYKLQRGPARPAVKPVKQIAIVEVEA